MTADELENLFNEDDDLRVGGKVELHWTNSGRSHTAVATVTKLNAKSLRARLDHEVGTPRDPFGHYPAGREITVPRIDDPKRWTVNNCARAYTPPAENSESTDTTQSPT